MTLTTATSTGNVCARIEQRIQQAIGSRRYHMWFDRSAQFNYDVEKRKLAVAVPNRFVADWIGRHFDADLRRAAKDELGDLPELVVYVAPQNFPDVNSVPNNETTITIPLVKRPASRQPTLRYQLENFVVGSSNELAFAAANRLLKNKQVDCNLLFIHGESGLGKTHLLQGICRQFQESNPERRSLYTTGEQFTNEFLLALRQNKIDLFRKKYRRLDLLAIDDVHFIANKQATQREYLHSFDAIECGGARIVMASDCHPKLINNFSEALASRCMHGMVVQVHQPDTATRFRIVRTLAQRRGISLTEAVVNTICTRSFASVREIEGTLTKLHALANLTEARGLKPDDNGVIGHALLRQLFDDRPMQTLPRKAVRFHVILSVIADQFGINREKILGSSRHQHIVLARGLVVYLARKLTAMSYPEIAAAMKRKNHSTAITAIQRIERELAKNEILILPSSMEPTSLSDLIDHLEYAIRKAQT